jgi:hypothetical protein
MARLLGTLFRGFEVFVGMRHAPAKFVNYKALPPQMGVPRGFRSRHFVYAVAVGSAQHLGARIRTRGLHVLGI